MLTCVDPVQDPLYQTVGWYWRPGVPAGAHALPVTSCLITSLRSPVVHEAMLNPSPNEPVWAELESRLQVGELVPKPVGLKQVGVTPEPASRDGFSTLSAEASAGPATYGCTAPPITWSIVTTCVVLGRCKSQSTNWVNTSREISLTSPVDPTWWNTIGTSPPLSFSAWVTYFCRIASVVSARTEVFVLIAYGSAGGTALAVTHDAQP